MDSTVRYYEENAADFIKNTVDIDMSVLYSYFLENIPAKGYILDAGCGSGRDSKFFLK